MKNLNLLYLFLLCMTLGCAKQTRYSLSAGNNREVITSSLDSTLTTAELRQIIAIMTKRDSLYELMDDKVNYYNFKSQQSKQEYEELEKELRKTLYQFPSSSLTK